MNKILKFEPRILFVVTRYASSASTSPRSKLREFYQPRGLKTVLDCGIYKNLPEGYKKFYLEWKFTPPKPVHYVPEEGIFHKDEETGQISRVQNVPIQLSESNLEDEGIWGGEAVIDGYVRIFRGKKKNIDLGPAPRFWFPVLFKSVIYSEVLDKNMVCDLTTRAQILINNHHGLDYYLLETRACDLRNSLALKLKRKILQALYHKTLYPNDEKKRDEVYDQYKKYLDDYTEEEIEWYGLTLHEARIKMAGENLRKAEIPKEPLKHLYRREFIDELKLGEKELAFKPWYKKTKLLPFK